MILKLLRQEDLVVAAELFVQGYQKQREVTPDLPDRYELVENVLPLIERFYEPGLGVGAFEDDRLVGYLQGVEIQPLKGEHGGVYAPEWCHGAIAADRVRIYEKMYSAISEEWVQRGLYNQAIGILNYDRELQDFWFYSGFGLHVIDCIRPMEPIDRSQLPAAQANLRIVQVTDAEIDDLLELGDAHERYYSTGPIFLPFFEMDTERSWYEEYLAEQDQQIWLAYQDDQPVAFLMGKPANPRSSGLIMDQGTYSVGGAYTDPSARGQGVGTLLLAEVIDWAKAHDYQRYSVDFESANIYGRKFWLRHFQPFGHSLLRHVDDRMAKAVNVPLERSLLE